MSEYGGVQNNYLISDARYASGDKDDYFKRISRTPDKKFYIKLDSSNVNDPEFFNKPLYPFENSTSSWSITLINDIKYRMTSMPPLYNWDKMDKVIFELNFSRKEYLILKF